MVEHLFDRFEALRAEEETFPTCSESPYLVYGVTDGLLPQSAAWPYLTWFEGQLRSNRDQLAGSREARPESEVVCWSNADR